MGNDAYAATFLSFVGSFEETCKGFLGNLEIGGLLRTCFQDISADKNLWKKCSLPRIGCFAIRDKKSCSVVFLAVTILVSSFDLLAYSPIECFEGIGGMMSVG